MFCFCGKIQFFFFLVLIFPHPHYCQNKSTTVTVQKINHDINNSNIKLLLWLYILISVEVAWIHCVWLIQKHHKGINQLKKSYFLGLSFVLSTFFFGNNYADLRFDFGICISKIPTLLLVWHFLFYCVFHWRKPTLQFTHFYLMMFQFERTTWNAYMSKFL